MTWGNSWLLFPKHSPWRAEDASHVQHTGKRNGYHQQLLKNLPCPTPMRPNARRSRALARNYKYRWHRTPRSLVYLVADVVIKGLDSFVYTSQREARVVCCQPPAQVGKKFVEGPGKNPHAQIAMCWIDKCWLTVSQDRFKQLQYIVSIWSKNWKSPFFFSSAPYNPMEVEGS